jgi:ectoine hydroxylase
MSTSFQAAPIAHDQRLWSKDELQAFRDDGFVIQRGLVSNEELRMLRDTIPTVLSGDDGADGLHRERERSGAVRQVYLSHRFTPAFRALAHNPKIVGPVRQLLGTDAYIWHSKINVKDAFEGTVWLWHQDYGYWLFDGVEPRLVSVMVLLDRATVNNGSLMIVPGSHHWGRVDHYSDTVTTSYKQWCIKQEVLKERLREEQIQHVTGDPGDVLFFDSNLVHGSGHNMSPLPRNTYIIVYNAVDNRPRSVENPRPDWVVSRDFETVPFEA